MLLACDFTLKTRLKEGGGSVKAKTEVQSSFIEVAKLT